jgi:hypothetical protein
MIPLCDIALFGFFYVSDVCSGCHNNKELSYYHQSYEYDCECKYVRISIIPIIDKKDDYEGRQLFAIPEIDGKIVKANEIIYNIVIEKEMLKEEFTGQIGKIELELLFDVGAEDEYYRDMDKSFFRYYNVFKNEKIFFHSSIKGVEKYSNFFMEKLQSIVVNNSKNVEQKENSHVGKIRKK